MGTAAYKIDENFQPIILSQENIQKMNFDLMVPVNVIKNGNSFSMLHKFKFELTMNDQKVIRYNDLDGTTQTYCLTQNSYDSLISKINEAKVCKFLPQQGVDEVCAQVMVSPYATLITNREHILLGASTDTCGANKMDLCSADPLALKNWIESFQQQLDQFNCH